MSWYGGKGEIREYLRELNKDKKVRTYSPWQLGMGYTDCKKGIRILAIPARAINQLPWPPTQYHEACDDARDSHRL